MAIGISSSFNEPDESIDMTNVKPLRKGARAIAVHGVPFSWIAGKSTVEIRNRLTNKAYHVPKHRLSEVITDWDDDEHAVVTPAMVSSFIAREKDEHGLL